MKKFLVSTSCVLIIAIWIFVSPTFLGTTFAALFVYPIWLFIGLFGVLVSLLTLQPKISSKLGQASLAFGLALVLTPIIWLPSVSGYNQYKYDRVNNALDEFIVSMAETGTPPENFQLRGQPDNLVNDVSREYEIIFVDELLGVYEIVVAFSSGTEYYFSIDKHRGNWDFRHSLQIMCLS